jgi:hypothetical protein
MTAQRNKQKWCVHFNGDISFSSGSVGVVDVDVDVEIVF